MPFQNLKTSAFSLLFTFLLTLPLFAQTHPHVSNIRYRPEVSILEWKSTEHNDADETPASTKVESWRISFSQLQMEKEKEAPRKFGAEEALRVSQIFLRFAEFLSSVIGERSEEIILEPSEGTAKVNGKHVLTHDCEPNLSARQCQSLNSFARAVVSYTLESIEWWKRTVPQASEQKI